MTYERDDLEPAFPPMAPDALDLLCDGAMADLGVEMEVVGGRGKLVLLDVTRTHGEPGAGRAALLRLCALADAHGMPVTLAVEGNERKLARLYERLGFETVPAEHEDDGNHYMVRHALPAAPEDPYGLTARPMTELGDGGEPPGRDEALALAEALEAHPGAFVSFQEHDALGLNPDYSNYVTPRAVYGFPVATLVARARAHAEARNLATTALAGMGYVRRANAFVFRVDGPVLDTRTYRDFAADSARLSAMLDDEGELALVHSWTRNGSPRLGTEVDPRRLFMMTEALVDHRLGLSRADGPYRPHPAKPEAWRRLLLSLGHDALLDMQGMVTGDVRDQVLVLRDGALDVVARLDNPCSMRMASCPMGPGTR